MTESHFPRRTLLVASSGGHLAQLLELRPWWETKARSWATFATPDTISQLEGEQVDFVHHPTSRNVPNLVRNVGVAYRVLRRRRPELVVSTGAAAAIPFFLLARMFGIKTAYIEVYDRITTATVTGRICYRLASVFLVQWEAQLALYPRATVIGGLL